MWLFILILNYGLSWYNARMAARSWRDARSAGGGAVLLCWGGAILAALGFTWCYLTLALAGAHSFGLVVASRPRVVAELGVLVLMSTAVGAVLLAFASCWIANFPRPALLAVTPAGSAREEKDAGDPLSMIVLFAILAGTAILGVVQTYMIIRSGVAEGERRAALTALELSRLRA